MSVRAQNGGDRMRTVWTPEMDQYFIDLMLEQLSKGNRFDDPLFSKRAWKQMTSLFSAKFKFQYRKDVLKNRYKTLRSLYKAIKSLLEQKGFSWDEMRQMVTADNNVWEEYIKVHPDARTYRIKTVPYYNDLCLIYGNKTIEQKGDNLPDSSSHLSEKEIVMVTPLSSAVEDVNAIDEIMLNEDNKISMPKGVVDDTPQAKPNVTGTTVGSRSRTYWQPPMDRYFIDLMLDQVQKGNRIDGVFRKEAWIEMIASFNAKFGFSYDMEILKNRYKTLRRQYNVIKNLLDLNGFVWDDARQMVTADDYVWQDYVKTHTDARQFMTRPVPYFKDLCVICGDSSLDESDCFSIQEIEMQKEVHEVKFLGGPNDSQSPVASNSCEDEVGYFLESAHAGSKSVVSSSKKKRQFENWSNSACIKKLRCKHEGMCDTPHEIVSLSDSKNGDENSNIVPIENVIAAVQALPDMDEDLVLDACDFLEDEVKAKTFMALDVKFRKKWLLRKLRPQL
ncbi:L10-interacting MYB domain-containing protein [Pistacia vera]|uniref:L10-interacting MYB domain-containing protein n=1 Tax=Pistacia vera TaxID=55513 RepID=UPI0012635C56|nr:L10-interacting MYB domain-containing protein [Pistacia vera]